jgi:molybdenum cofactor synthesis domain-containing protein
MYKVAIITSSDKGFAGEREDASGRVIEEIVNAHGFEVADKVILPDEKELLSAKMKDYCRQGIELVLTTGGTGFSKRDVTPEATADVVERRADSLTTAMMANSLKYTPKAMLSRGIAGICDETLIVNLPGSPKAVRENLEYAIDAIRHGIQILKGDDGECARK